MGSILKEADRAEISRRMRSLSGASDRRWGTLDVTGMLQHLRLSANMTLGELSLPSANKRAFQVFPLKHLILYVFPFPKGAPTAAGLRASTTASFDEERGALLALVDRLAAGPQAGPGPDHPLFGRLSRSEWGVITYKHINHH